MKYLILLSLVFLTSCFTVEVEGESGEIAKKMYDDYGAEKSLLILVEAAYVQGTIDGDRYVKTDTVSRSFEWTGSPYIEGTEPFFDQSIEDNLEILTWGEMDRKKRKRNWGEQKEN